MSRTAKRLRSIAVTVIAIAATNYAISFASGVPIRPDAPRPRITTPSSGVPIRPDAPRPKAAGPSSGVPIRPDAPRP